jgi:hypothetical protein
LVTFLVNMLKEITRKDVLNTLREHEIRFSKHPNSNNVITLERQEWNEYAESPEPFNVDVRFSHPNYIYLLSRHYSADKNLIRDGGFSVDIFSLVPRIKTVVEQLQDDGYLKIYSQECSFYTEKEASPEPFDEEYDYMEMEKAEYQIRTGEPYKRYIDAKKKFSEEELLALNVSIILTTKGQSRKLFIKERFFSEPIGAISLLISFIALLSSVFLK